MRPLGAGREADEVAALQGVLPVRRAQNNGAVDDEQPFLVVLVVIRRVALTGANVVHEHQGALRSQRLADVDPTIVVLGAKDVDRFHARHHINRR